MERRRPRPKPPIREEERRRIQVREHSLEPDENGVIDQERQALAQSIASGHFADRSRRGRESMGSWVPSETRVYKDVMREMSSIFHEWRTHMNDGTPPSPETWEGEAPVVQAKEMPAPEAVDARLTHAVDRMKQHTARRIPGSVSYFVANTGAPETDAYPADAAKAVRGLGRQLQGVTRVAEQELSYHTMDRFASCGADLLVFVAHGVSNGENPSSISDGDLDGVRVYHKNHTPEKAERWKTSGSRSVIMNDGYREPVALTDEETVRVAGLSSARTVLLLSCESARVAGYMVQHVEDIEYAIGFEGKLHVSMAKDFNEHFMMALELLDGQVDAAFFVAIEMLTDYYHDVEDLQQQDQLLYQLDRFRLCVKDEHQWGSWLSGTRKKNEHTPPSE